MNPPSTRSMKKRHSLKKKRQRHRSRKQHIHTTPTLSKNVSVIKTSVIASCPKHNDLEDRIRGALWGLFIGDALAMPVHWYYSLHQLKQDFGCIDGYYSPKAYFPGSIMALSNTGGAGRGSNDGDIIGSVILHGKKKVLGTRHQLSLPSRSFARRKHARCKHCAVDHEATSQRQG